MTYSEKVSILRFLDAADASISELSVTLSPQL